MECPDFHEASSVKSADLLSERAACEKRNAELARVLSSAATLQRRLAQTHCEALDGPEWEFLARIVAKIGEDEPGFAEKFREDKASIEALLEITVENNLEGLSLLGHLSCQKFLEFLEKIAKLSLWFPQLKARVSEIESEVKDRVADIHKDMGENIRRYKKLRNLKKRKGKFFA